MPAIGTQRILNKTSISKSKSSEKLSSGYKINRAADNAAGLSISEKMRSQIRGLNQAARNIQDGINVIQVADSALNETHSILQRMNEHSSLGASQNRLEHALSNAQNSSENTQAAESRIRDVNLADEMVSYSSNNILIEAGQSMLAQANKSNQSVLGLLG